MKIKILKEAGYDEALLGLSLSYGTSPERAEKIVLTLASKDGGHNKFLESIIMWVDVTAPRYWWSEADTYRLSSKQSSSTMHTIGRRYLEQSDFAMPIDDTYLMKINELVAQYGSTKTIEPLVQLKNMLPEGFLQRRVWCMSYKTMRNIIHQRHDHRLPQWREFCHFIGENAEHKELLLSI